MGVVVKGWKGERVKDARERAQRKSLRKEARKAINFGDKKK